MARDFYQKLLTGLIGLAVGSLASSALFHLIPQAFGITSDPEGHHSYLFISLAVLGGIWGFFMIETIIKVVLSAQTCRKNGSLRNSGSDQAIVPQKHCDGTTASVYYCHPNDFGNHRRNDITLLKHSVACSIQEKESFSFECPESPSEESPNLDSCHLNNPQLIYDSQRQSMKASFGHVQEMPERRHSPELIFRQGEDSVIATVAWMIIFGDGFHNFIDGVSIGAAFQQSILTGISISLAVLCEELPHELGDFAVLISSGMSMKQALFYNFLSATTCYLGMVIGILLGEFTETSSYIFAFAGGMFLYISLADMLPEMNETSRKASIEGPWEVTKVLILQNIGIMFGVASLFLLAYYQDLLTLQN